MSFLVVPASLTGISSAGSRNEPGVRALIFWSGTSEVYAPGVHNVSVALTGFDKAIVAGVLAALGAFLTALQASGGSPGTKEYILAALTGVGVGVATFFKSNAPAAAPAPAAPKVG